MIYYSLNERGDKAKISQVVSCITSWSLRKFGLEQHSYFKPFGAFVQYAWMRDGREKEIGKHSQWKILKGERLKIGNLSFPKFFPFP